MKKEETPSRGLRIGFLARDREEINKLVRICRLLGKVEKFPKNLITSYESPRIYSFTLRLKTNISKDVTTNWLLDTGVVESVGPAR